MRRSRKNRFTTFPLVTSTGLMRSKFPPSESDTLTKPFGWVSLTRNTPGCVVKRNAPFRSVLIALPTAWPRLFWSWILTPLIPLPLSWLMTRPAMTRILSLIHI